jgi:hypothetical protein
MVRYPSLLISRITGSAIGLDKAFFGQSGSKPDIAAVDAVEKITFKKSRRFISVDIIKPSFGCVRGGLTLDIAFQPHLPCGKATLYELQVGGARQPSLDVTSV